MKTLRKPVPVWVFLIVILATASILTGVFLGPEIQNILGPRKDFRMQPQYASTDQSSNNILVGNGPSLNIAVSSINGFTGIVRTTVTQSPYVNATFNTQYPAAVLSYDPVTMSVPDGNIRFAITGTNIGNYTITVTGTSGGITHFMTMSGSVQSLAFSASPDPLVVPQHSSANMTVTITSVNKLSGNLTLAGRSVTGSGYLASLNVTLISPTLNCGRCNGPGAPYPLASNGSVGVIVMVTWQYGSNNNLGFIGRVVLDVQVPGLAGDITHDLTVIFS